MPFGLFKERQILVKSRWSPFTTAAILFLFGAYFSLFVRSLVALWIGEPSGDSWSVWIAFAYTAAYGIAACFIRGRTMNDNSL